MPREIYITTVNKPAPRKSLEDTVLKPPHAWGLLPGKSNDFRWARLEIGDALIFKYDGAYRVSTNVIKKEKDAATAEKLWGTRMSSMWERRSYELMIYLSKPRIIEVPVDGLEMILGARHVGLQRLLHERLVLAHKHFGGKQKFETAFGQVGGSYSASARIADKKRDANMAQHRWGTETWGGVWSLIFLLDRPTMLSLPSEWDGVFGKHPGMRRIPPERLAGPVAKAGEAEFKRLFGIR